MTEDKKHFSNFKIGVDVKILEGKELMVNGAKSCDILKTNRQEFNYYEYVANPRIILDNTKLSFNPQQIQKIIKEIFTCSFCLDIFNEPVNNKNCLHKFCKKCIEDYIRLSKKECTICKQVIETKRHLREDEKMKSLISCVIPDPKKYSDKIDFYFMKNIQNYCLNDEKKLKIKEDLLKGQDGKLENTKNANNDNTNRNLREFIDLNCENKNEDLISIKDNTIPYTMTTKIQTAETENNYSFLINNINGNSLNLDNSSKILNTGMISKKTQRNEFDFELPGLYESIKRRKIDKEIKKFEVPLHVAEKEIKESKKNILGVKLFCEKDSATNIFNNLKLYTSEEMTLEDFSLYILNKRMLNFNLSNRLNFYVYYSNQAIDLNKNNTLKEIKDKYKMDPENVNIYFYFK